MKATGQLLKSRREALKISIAEVSISTKITSRMLQAIENGDMDLLPARTFLRGFVKSYATYLKMDVEQVLKSFNAEMTALEPQPIVATPGESEPRVEAPALTTSESSGDGGPSLMPEGVSILKKAGLGLGLAVLVALIVMVYGLVQKYEREGQVEEPPASLTKIESETSPETKAAPKTVEVEPSKPKVEAKTEPEVKAETPKGEESKASPVAEATPKPSPTEAKPTPVETKPETLKVADKPPETKPSPEAAKIPDKPVEAKPTPDTPKLAEKPAPKPPETKSAVSETKPAENAQAPTPKPPTKVEPPVPKPTEVAQPKVEPKKPEAKPPEESKPGTETPTTRAAATATGTQEIIIEALDKVDIVFRVNNGQSKKVSLQPDQVHTIKAVGQVAIEMSDGGAVNIIHNGRDVGVPGDLGRPKKLSLP